MRDETLARLAADTIALLERDGPVVFDRFAQSTIRPRRHGGEFYKGGNAVALWMTAELKGYSSPFWMTYKQAQEYGGQVRKGEKSSLVLYWDRFTVKGEDGKPVLNDDGDERGGMFCKASTVFNACQIDGLDAKFFPVDQKRSAGFPDDATVEAFISATGAKIDRNASAAVYRPALDQIGMPPRERFADASAYYATLLHELIHWTGADKRLGRLTAKRFGDASYALEELVAEIGAAMLCTELGLHKEPRQDHAHYLHSWLKALKNDPRNLWTAGSAADKACSFLQDMQPKEERIAA